MSEELRYKVVKGLECCIEKLDTVTNKTHGFNCTACPYFKRCDSSGYLLGLPLMKDALALLKAQKQATEQLRGGYIEILITTAIALKLKDVPLPTDAALEMVRRLKAQQPRLLTLEEVESTIKELAPLWVEVYLNDGEDSSGWRIGWTRSKYGKPKEYLMENYISRLTLTEPTYGKFWRCWTSRPNEKVRAETPWQPQ